MHFGDIRTGFTAVAARGGSAKAPNTDLRGQKHFSSCPWGFQTHQVVLSNRWHCDNVPRAGFWVASQTLAQRSSDRWISLFCDNLFKSNPGFVMHRSLFFVKTREVFQRAAELLLGKNKSVGNGHLMPNRTEIKFDPHHLLQRLWS